MFSRIRIGSPAFFSHFCRKESLKLGLKNLLFVRGNSHFSLTFNYEHLKFRVITLRKVRRSERWRLPMTDDLNSATPGIPRTVVFNFLLFLIFGALLLGWCYRYTDWITVIGGFLSLAGMLSWLAVMLKVIPEKRMGEFQVWADRALLGNNVAKWFVLALLLTGLVAASFLGTVEVIWPTGEGSRSVWIHRPGTSAGDADALIPGGTTRRLFFTFWRPRTSVRVKVSGFPDRIV